MWILGISCGRESNSGRSIGRKGHCSPQCDESVRQHLTANKLTDLHPRLIPSSTGSQTKPIDIDVEVGRHLAELGHEWVTTKLASSASTNLTPHCYGIHLVMQPGISPCEGYPFVLHVKLKLPWNLHIMNDQLTLLSIHCHGCLNPIMKSHACREYEKLLTHNVFEGIMDRMRDGMHENSMLTYQPIGGLIEVVWHKNNQLNVL